MDTTDWKIDPENKEYFSFLVRTWDVDKCKQALMKKRREVESYPIGCLLPALSYVHTEEGKVETADPTVPVIIGTVAVGRGKAKRITPMILDGHHRLRKAKELGLETVPVVTLTERETKAAEVRLPGLRGR